MTRPVSQRRTMLLLLALFGLPLVVSFVLYYATDWRPPNSSNHGQLFSPTIALDEAATPGDALAALKGKWSLLVVGNGDCGADCQRNLIFARQTRLSLNQEMDRVNRVFLVTGQCCDREYLNREHPGLTLIEPGATVDVLLQRIPAPDREHSVFVVDPLGNLVMRYDSREDPKGFLTDIKKLLKLSHIG
ncbi:MAG: hypothetical protein LBE59_08710 [Nevskiaceae bacterium]|jgi:hypothetical protein|nr:hypothetical protein [Nevskiaceae bacterium]